MNAELVPDCANPECQTPGGCVPKALLSKAQARRLESCDRILALLRQNSRMSLSVIARTLRLPVSTVFGYVKDIERTHRFVCLPRQNVKCTDLSGLPYGWRRIIEQKEARLQRLAVALRYNARKPNSELARELNISQSTVALDSAVLEQRFQFTVEDRVTPIQPPSTTATRFGPFPRL